MIDSIQASYISQAREQGRPIVSSENRYYLSSLQWKLTVEGDLFWNILYYSYSMYWVYDYETLLRIYMRFNSVPNYSNNNNNIAIYYIYRQCFDKEKGTLTDEGFENLIKEIEK